MVVNLSRLNIKLILEPKTIAKGSQKCDTKNKFHLKYENCRKFLKICFMVQGFILRQWFWLKAIQILIFCVSP